MYQHIFSTPPPPFFLFVIIGPISIKRGKSLKINKFPNLKHKVINYGFGSVVG